MPLGGGGGARAVQGGVLAVDLDLALGVADAGVVGAVVVAAVRERERVSGDVKGG